MASEWPIYFDFHMAGTRPASPSQHHYQPRIAAEERVFSHSDRLHRGFDGTPGFSFLFLFFLFFVRALILSRLTRVMGNVYVFSRIKAALSGALWLRFRDGVVELPAPPPC